MYDWQTIITFWQGSGEYIIGAAVALTFVYLKKIWAEVMATVKMVANHILSRIGVFLNQRGRFIVALRGYLRNELARRDLTTVRIPGALNQDTRLDLADVYIPLDLAGNDKKTYRDSSLMFLGNRIMVTGDPGSGKSTLIKKMYLKACRNSNWWQLSRFPVRLPLKDLQPDKNGDWLYRAIRSKLPGKDLRACLDACLDGEGVLVLLDGLDEVSQYNYPAVRDGILTLHKDLANRSANNTIILTLRSQYHAQVGAAFAEAFPHRLDLAPLSAGQFQTFLNRWPFGASDRDRVAAAFEATPSLKQMCNNPLVLAMYLARDQERRGNPNNRTAFYQLVVYELLFHRRKDQLGAQREFLAQQRRYILGRWAWEHLCQANQPANTLGHSEVLSLILATVPGEVDPERFLAEMATQTGLISPQVEGISWVMLHLSFLEFLAADYLTRDRVDGVVEALAQHVALRYTEAGASRLVEVFPFLAHLVLPVVRPQLMNNLKELPTVVALRCLVELTAYDQPVVKGFLHQVRDDLLDELEVPVLLWFQINTLRANQELGKPLVAREAFFTDLIRRNEGSIETLLQTYARESPSDVFRLVTFSRVDAIDYPGLLRDNLPDPSFRAALLAYLATQDPSEAWALTLIKITGDLRRWVLAEEKAIPNWGVGRDLTHQLLTLAGFRYSPNVAVEIFCAYARGTPPGYFRKKFFLAMGTIVLIFFDFVIFDFSWATAILIPSLLILFSLVAFAWSGFRKVEEFVNSLSE